jgi:phage-related minor tail protein
MIADGDSGVPEKAVKFKRVERTPIRAKTRAATEHNTDARKKSIAGPTNVRPEYARKAAAAREKTGGIIAKKFFLPI